MEKEANKCLVYTVVQLRDVHGSHDQSNGEKLLIHFCSTLLFSYILVNLRLVYFRSSLNHHSNDGVHS